jgi:peptidyl-prolyl cis-trans isomerase C
MRLVFALCLLLTACGSSGPREEVVAHVGNAYLEVSTLEALLPYGASEEDRQRAITDWIGSELLYREAIDRGLHESLRLQQQLESTRRNLLVAALLDDELGSREVDVTETEIQRYYEKNGEVFRREVPEVQARHILLSSQRQANARRNDLRRGADFSVVARSHSEDVDTRDKGGELDVFSRADDPALWNACEDLELNELSQPVRTEYGYHLIEVQARYEANSVRPLEQVRGQIVEKLVWQTHRQRMDQLVETLKEREDWGINAQ